MPENSHPATGPDDLYAAKPPWDIDRPQPAFLTLAEDGKIRAFALLQQDHQQQDEADHHVERRKQVIQNHKLQTLAW